MPKNKTKQFDSPFFFYNIIDPAANNAYILLGKVGKNKLPKKIIKKNMTFNIAKSTVGISLSIGVRKEGFRGQPPERKLIRDMHLHINNTLATNRQQ